MIPVYHLHLLYLKKTCSLSSIIGPLFSGFFLEGGLGSFSIALFYLGIWCPDYCNNSHLIPFFSFKALGFRMIPFVLVFNCAMDVVFIEFIIFFKIFPSCNIVFTFTLLLFLLFSCSIGDLVTHCSALTDSLTEDFYF